VNVADASNQPEPLGPPMLSATEILRTPPTRIGKITESIVLPRTVSLVSLIATGAGLVLGALLSLPFFSVVGLRGVLLTTGLMGALGLAVVTLSPIKGESFTKWLGLTAASLTKPRVQVNGRAARVYIGIAPLKATAAGAVQVLGSAAEVRAGDTDERGVLLTGEQLRTRTKTSALERAGSARVRSDWNPESQDLPKGGFLPSKPRKEGSGPKALEGERMTRGKPKAVPAQRGGTPEVVPAKPSVPAGLPEAEAVLEAPKKLSKAKKKR
jgi:hypothetical protein